MIQQIFVAREYDLTSLKRSPEIWQFYQASKRPLIVDVGANIGTSTVWFGCQYPRAKIIAVEPSLAISVCSKPTSPTSTLARCAVRSPTSAGRATCLIQGEGEWGYRTHGGGAPITSVRAFTLRELVSLEPDATPFILKIDVEGAELALFEDDPEAYNRFPIVIIEIHDWMLSATGHQQVVSALALG